MGILGHNRNDHFLVLRANAEGRLPGSLGRWRRHSGGFVVAKAVRSEPESLLWLSRILLSSALLLCFAVTVASSQVAKAGEERVGEPAVLLELFTSQGCSSCPPADRLLRQLAESEAAGPVVALSFHVDYWNYLGWDDPFASAEWSDRQRRYANSLNLDTVYTPQLVVNGAEHCVGSGWKEVKRLVHEARGKMAEGQVKLLARFPEARAQEQVLRLSVASMTDASGPVDMMIVIFENGLETDVSSGENRSRLLENDYVVRRLVRHERLKDAGMYRDQLELALDPEWDVNNIGVAAFLQRPKTLEVVQATAVLPLSL